MRRPPFVIGLDSGTQPYRTERVYLGSYSAVRSGSLPGHVSTYADMLSDSTNTTDL